MEGENVQIHTNTGRMPDISEQAVREIVEAVLSGKTQRFEEVFELFHNMVFYLAWNLTGNYDDALDVVQECFLRAFRALSSWKKKARFATWLHRIAINTAIDYIRREAKHQAKRIASSGIEDMDEEIERLTQGVDSRTPLTELKQKELRRRILHAVNQLAGRQRRCFILRYYSDLDIKEIALVVGCGEGTVKRHLFRARKRLQAWLLPE
jgi:RNA polymerase sigma-70 factor (ECF subfamily)